MAKFEDDELQDIPLVTKKTSTPKPTPIEDDEDEPVTPSAAATTQKSTAVEDDAEDLSIEFGNSKLMIKGDGLNRIRADATKVARFALLPFVNADGTPIKDAKGKVISGLFPGNNHFVESKDKKGFFRCAPVKNEGETPYCCQKLDEEGVFHAVALALHYTNANSDNGSYEKGTPIEWEVGYVDLSRAHYRAISNLAPEDSTVYDIDMVMAKEGAGKSSRYGFTLKSQKARWKQNPALVEEVEAAAQKFIRDGGKKLKGKLGKKLNLIEWKALLAGTTASSSAEASLDDIESL